MSHVCVYLCLCSNEEYILSYTHTIYMYTHTHTHTDSHRNTHTHLLNIAMVLVLAISWMIILIHVCVCVHDVCIAMKHKFSLTNTYICTHTHTLTHIHRNMHTNLWNSPWWNGNWQFPEWLLMHCHLLLLLCQSSIAKWCKRSISEVTSWLQTSNLLQATKILTLIVKYF